MTKNSGQIIRKALDVFLIAEGFRRDKSVWTRPRDGFVDVIDFQTSSFASEFTLNAGIYKSDIYEDLYGSLPTSMFAANCIIEKRAGALANNDLDYWWPLNDPGTPYEIVVCAKEYVLPFLDSHHSFKSMVEFLEHKKVQKYTGFPESYYLAVLYCRTDRMSDGCMLLRQLQDKAKKIMGKRYNAETEPTTRLLQKYGCLMN